VFESERHLLTRLAETGYAFSSQTGSMAINREARTIMCDDSSPVADATLAPVAATPGDDDPAARVLCKKPPPGRRCPSTTA